MSRKESNNDFNAEEKTTEKKMNENWIRNQPLDQLLFSLSFRLVKFLASLSSTRNGFKLRFQLLDQTGSKQDHFIRKKVYLRLNKLLRKSIVCAWYSLWWRLIAQDRQQFFD